MISRLGYALLALLARQPGTGYELSARAHRPLGYFWSAQHSQIYPELRKLLDAGLVGFDSRPGPGPREKKVYFLTGAGHAELAAWVARPPEASAAGRDDVLLKAYASWTADPGAASAVFEGEIAGHRERLDRYLAEWDQVRRGHRDGPPTRHPDFGSYATLRFGIDYERQRIAWLTWLVGQLSGSGADVALDVPAGSVPAERGGEVPVPGTRGGLETGG